MYVNASTILSLIWVSHRKSQFGYILEGLEMDYVGIFHGCLVQFVVIWYIFPSFGMFGQRNIRQPCLGL
jgi:hypothetical protein